MNTIATNSHQPWNKGKFVGQKAPLRVRDIWAIRVRLLPLIEHPWSWELLVDLPGGAACFTVHNQGSQADRLVGINTPRARKSVLHAQAAKDGLMDMQHAPVMDIPAHAEVIFQPGANHVMLSGMDQPLKAGEQFPLTLVFEKAGKVEVQIKVQPADVQTGHDFHSRH